MSGSEDQLPLQGVVLCCTSLAQDIRTHIAETATQMGAVHKLDLTSDVTHLLVGCINTPKYKYVAKERPDIKVLSTEFIVQAREAWIAGEQVDVKKLEDDFKMKTFSGLEMCLTGFNDVAQRKEMEQTCLEQGARWSADLTKQVTHLIAAKPEGAKYTHAKQWGIAVVGLKWYEDSLLRGMALEESYYACELSREQQGVGALRTMSKRTSLGKRGREDSQTAAGAGAGEELGRRKLRKSASMRLGGQSQDLWQSMSQHEVHVDNTVVDAWGETNDESQTLRDSIGPGAGAQHSHATEAIDRHDPKERHGVFAGHFVFVYGFDLVKTEKLRSVVSLNGATVVDNITELDKASGPPFPGTRCLLMPHAQPTRLPEVPSGTILVTEWWVERCLHFKQQIDPHLDTLSQPMQDRLVEDFVGLVISSTGFNSVDLRMSAETIKLMGGSYEEQLGSSTSVLICASEPMKKEKAFYASKHKIPVVHPDWLWESLKSKSKVPIEPYSLDLSSYDFSQFSQSVGSPALSGNFPDRRSHNGTRRAEELAYPKRLSNTRKRQPAPSLMLKPTSLGHMARVKSRSQPAAFIQPFVLEDDDVDGAQAVSTNGPILNADVTQVKQPLREVSPNASQRSHNAGKVPANNHILEKPQSTSPLKSATQRTSPAKQAQKLTSDLAAIVRQRSGSGQEAVIEPPRRKDRPLGRNLSATSIASFPSKSTSGMDAMTEECSEADGFAPLREPVLAPAGTQLGYDSPEAEAARIEMSRKMGVAVEESSGIRIASMGTVKDSEDMRKSSAGGCAKSRARTKT
ncbi:Putative BRCT domain-containing protein [Septoria linicola]|uniref:BRCT domain-containing protein n=1 Tax=Septoria linicola TaxID=215465 RepID=A0A9Q9EH27_9PEZI|nr:putative BRCT domain-containing protein [Septoria linicola]USW49544.1 Putative BRCT domain-containing protein [Septoria linicola]